MFVWSYRGNSLGLREPRALSPRCVTNFYECKCIAILSAFSHSVAQCNTRNRVPVLFIIEFIVVTNRFYWYPRPGAQRFARATVPISRIYVYYCVPKFSRQISWMRLSLEIETTFFYLHVPIKATISFSRTFSSTFVKTVCVRVDLFALRRSPNLGVQSTRGRICSFRRHIASTKNHIPIARRPLEL